MRMAIQERPSLLEATVFSNASYIDRVNRLEVLSLLVAAGADSSRHPYQLYNQDPGHELSHELGFQNRLRLLGDPGGCSPRSVSARRNSEVMWDIARSGETNYDMQSMDDSLSSITAFNNICHDAWGVLIRRQKLSRGRNF